MLKQLKPKKCKACGVMFTPFRGLQKVCSQSCAFVYNRNEKIRKQRQYEAKRLREGRERNKTLSDHRRELQGVFNRWTRLRDAQEPCISCQRHHKGQYHAGHYIAIGMGGGSPLRFEPDNCHRQCSACNGHMGGNLINYRTNLVKKIGLERVEWLEGPHEALKLTIDDIKLLKSDYSAKANSLAKELDNYTR